ncbi:UDP-N-acetylmuramoyl-L-alanine--D-glutamate ligase [Polluticoccus soli]|uniref:UDP-N-acetylmuramoyl-L-alanine--D-glutamate ligase n=1 Tax=Polluticoccus soli TaxID=3034150 RepID=UPI0023E27C97|nr:UDP-N-acetylmuramoyl-L-alanine--D-glutamate ligase [Flavipsychrobacter sp. JY13-12]
MDTHTNKRLVVLGAAESGIGAALLGKQQGWDVFVSDGGNIKEQYKKTLQDAQIAFEEGGHTLDKILNAEVLVKSPGIPEKVEIMKKVRAAGIEVCSEIEFGYRYKGDSKIIAITGSNGKSTTTKLTHHLLTDAGYDAALVGNIGYSFARQIAERPAEWYVMEISSFQLDDIHQFRPDVAVLLNITPDHLDRYDYKFENYIASKFRIAENQRPQDYFIINKDDQVITNYLTTHSIKSHPIKFTMSEQLQTKEGGYISGNDMHIQFGGEDLNMSIHDLALKGKHNQSNSMAAGISARIAGIRKEKIRESFSSFEGLEHRLEFVATVRGVDFINDSKATNVNSVWFALESMTKPTILILGGQDKGNDYNEIMELVEEKVKAIVCMGIDNAPIHAAFEGKVGSIVDTKSAVEAVQAAYSLADKGDAVLLSPACASFDLFKNYEDRGTQFKAAVHEL